MNTTYKAVIFDLDGTLLNTIDDLADSCNYVLAAKGYPTFSTEQFKKFVGNGAAVLMKRIHPQGTSQAELDEALAQFTVYYNAHRDIKTKPYEGIPDLLHKLREKGIRLCVLSNKPHEISALLIRHYFGDGTFDIVLGKSAGFPVKPDPSSCDYLLGQLELDQSDVLYVGDSNVDMQTARNAGLTSCGVCWGFRSEAELKAEGAHYLVHSPGDILEIVAGDGNEK